MRRSGAWPRTSAITKNFSRCASTRWSCFAVWPASKSRHPPMQLAMLLTRSEQRRRRVFVQDGPVRSQGLSRCVPQEPGQERQRRNSAVCVEVFHGVLSAGGCGHSGCATSHAARLSLDSSSSATATTPAELRPNAPAPRLTAPRWWTSSAASRCVPARILRLRSRYDLSGICARAQRGCAGVHPG